jgi:hypothetical protein
MVFNNIVSPWFNMFTACNICDLLEMILISDWYITAFVVWLRREKSYAGDIYLAEIDYYMIKLFFVPGFMSYNLSCLFLFDLLCLCSWNATYESLLGTREPFPQPIPLSVSLLCNLLILLYFVGVFLLISLFPICALKL